MDKKDLIYLHIYQSKIFRKKNISLITFLSLHFIFWTYSGNIGNFTWCTHVEFIFTIEGRNTNFGIARRGRGWRPEIFIVTMTTPLVRATVSINVIAICRKNAAKIRSLPTILVPSSFPKETNTPINLVIDTRERMEGRRRSRRIFLSRRSIKKE